MGDYRYFQMPGNRVVFRGVWELVVAYQVGCQWVDVPEDRSAAFSAGSSAGAKELWGISV